MRKFFRLTYYCSCCLFSCLLLFGCTPKSNNTELVHQANAPQPSHQAPLFNFVSAYGDSINNSNFEDQLYVVDFFFTRCPSFCPKMTEQMARLQDSFQMEQNFKLLSLTVDPDHDDLSALQSYANRYEANPSQWYFVRGDIEHTYEVISKGFLLSSDYNDKTPENISHSSRLVLVSKAGKILGYYDSLDEEAMTKLHKDIKKHLKS